MKTLILLSLFTFATSAFAQDTPAPEESSEKKYLFDHETRDEVFDFVNYEMDHENEREQQSSLELKVGGVYDSLVDGSESLTLVSEFQPMIEASWKQYWSQSFETAVGLQYVARAYVDIVDSNYAFTDREESQIGIFTQARKHIGDDLNLFARFTYGNQIYYKEIAENEISLQKENAMDLNLGFEYKVIEVRKLSASVLGQVQQVGPGDGQFKGGSGFGAGFSLNYQRSRNNSVRSYLYYNNGQYETDFTDFQRREAGIGFSYDVGF